VAVRNVGRRPARLALTIAALALAGALFMATFGLRQGLYGAVEILVGEFGADAQIDLAEPQATARLRRAAAGLDGVARVELWGVADGRRVYDDGRVGSSFTLYGVPPTTQIAPSAERAGSWLAEAELTPRREESKGAKEEEGISSLPLRLRPFAPWREPSSLPEIYINYETEKLLGRPGVGEALALRLNGREDAAARLVGISLRPFDAAAYMPYADFERATGQRGRVGRLVVYVDKLVESAGEPGCWGGGEKEAVADGFTPAPPLPCSPALQSVVDELTTRLEVAGIVVASAETAESFRAGYRAQFDGLVTLLTALAGLTALVGGLGLGNTMALNVLERSREIGVLRALGARRPLLRRLVLAEGLLIAVGSVALAVPLAVPLTLALDRVMGVSLLGSPLRFAFAPWAAAAWLGLVVVIAVVACWLPAERAGRMAIREALAYE
jgi:putative ABC transport system permease protein